MKDNFNEIIMILGTLIFGAGFTSCLGYIGDIEKLYRWGHDVGMAKNTAVAFLLTGIAIYLIGRKMKHETKRQT